MAKSFDALVKRTTGKTTQARAKARARELMGDMLLAELRQLTGKSQREVAEALGIRQPSLAKMEKQSDIQVSTLSRLVKALGGELEIRVRLPAGVFRLQQFGDPGP